MQFTYELTEEDFIEAYRAHRNRNAFSKWSLRIVFWFLIALAAAGVIAMVVLRDAQTAKNFYPLFVFVVIWIAVLRLLPRWNMRRQFRKQPAARGPKTISFESDGLHWSSDSGSGTSAWKNYIRWVEGKHQILLYNSPYYYIIVTTRTLAPAQLAELRELLKQNIQPGK